MRSDDNVKERIWKSFYIASFKQVVEIVEREVVLMFKVKKLEYISKVS